MKIAYRFLDKKNCYSLIEFLLSLKMSLLQFCTILNSRLRYSIAITFPYIKVIFICILFMAVGPILILLNKHIMHDLKFPYPMFLSGLGVVASGLFANMLVDFGYVAVENESQVKGSYYYYRILPIAISSAGKRKSYSHYLKRNKYVIPHSIPHLLFSFHITF